MTAAHNFLMIKAFYLSYYMQNKAYRNVFGNSMAKETIMWVGPM